MGNPYFMIESLNATIVPPIIKRTVDIHLISKFFIMYYIIECTLSTIIKEIKIDLVLIFDIQIICLDNHDYVVP
jgi:hypothetical protein